MMKSLMSVCLVMMIFTPFFLRGVPVRLVQKTAAEVVELAAKRSGRILSPAARKTAETAMRKAIFRYGDDAVRTVEKGGFATIMQGSKYGDDFWKLCVKASPDGVRSLSLHADELLPMVKRYGPDFLKLEGNAPGLGLKAVELFGDSAVGTFKNAPSSHISQMIGYAKRADNAETVKLLQKGYTLSGGKILKHLNWKHVAAGGLSASAVVAAYRLTGAAQILAEKNPEVFADLFSWPLTIGILAIIFLLCMPFFPFIWGCCTRSLAVLRKKPDSEKEENAQKQNP